MHKAEEEELKTWDKFWRKNFFSIETLCWCCRSSEEMMIPSEMPSVAMGENGHGNGNNICNDDNGDDKNGNNIWDGDENNDLVDLF